MNVTDRIGTLRHFDGTVVQCHGYPKRDAPDPQAGRRWWQTVVTNPRHKLLWGNEEIATWPVIFDGWDD